MSDMLKVVDKMIDKHAPLRTNATRSKLKNPSIFNSLKNEVSKRLRLVKVHKNDNEITNEIKLQCYVEQSLSLLFKFIS